MKCCSRAYLILWTTYFVTFKMSAIIVTWCVRLPDHLATERCKWFLGITHWLLELIGMHLVSEVHSPYNCYKIIERRWWMKMRVLGESLEESGNSLELMQSNWQIYFCMWIASIAKFLFFFFFKFALRVYFTRKNAKWL